MASSALLASELCDPRFLAIRDHDPEQHRLDLDTFECLLALNLPETKNP